jgi:6-phospho-3-hexuloisomerase
MPAVTRLAEDALADLKRVLSRVNGREMSAFAREILHAERIFVIGLGRTGLMARGFAMRLMHLGRRVYHVGDVITPRIGRGDLLVIGTRTGRSKVLLHYIGIARKVKARVAVVTAARTSPAARRADTLLAIDDRPSHSKRSRSAKGRSARRLPLGSLFEQAFLVVCDQIILDLMDALHLGERDLEGHHTTFE